jgi:hypothetical protein
MVFIINDIIGAFTTNAFITIITIIITSFIAIIIAFNVEEEVILDFIIIPFKLIFIKGLSFIINPFLVIITFAVVFIVIPC